MEEDLPMNLFEYNHRDEGGYLRHLEVRPSIAPGGGLALNTNPNGPSPACVLPVAKVEELRDVLNQWLAERTRGKTDLAPASEVALTETILGEVEKRMQAERVAIMAQVDTRIRTQLRLTFGAAWVGMFGEDGS